MENNHPSFLKIIKINLFVLLVLGFFGFIGIESYLRMTIGSSSGGSIFKYTQKTPRYKVMRKNASIEAWGVELKTNELGFRDKQSAVPAKQQGEFRVVLLGDSFSVSAGVEYDAIYSSLLEKNLRKEFNNLKIINLSVGGYNVVQYEMVLNEVALELQPDLVLVALFPTNDFSMQTYEKNRLQATGEFKQKALPWYKETYVYRAFLWRFESKLKAFANIKDKPEKKVPQSKQDMEAGWSKNLAALESIFYTTKQRGIPAAVIVLPNTWSYDSQIKDSDRVDAFLAKHDVPYLVLLKPFMESGVNVTELRLNFIDSHPNNRYHQMIAEYTKPFLESLIKK